MGSMLAPLSHSRYLFSHPPSYCHSPTHSHPHPYPPPPQYVVPAALTLLSDPKVDVKAANQDLLISLKRNLGDQVDQAGAGLSAAMRARLEAALEGVV